MAFQDPAANLLLPERAYAEALAYQGVGRPARAGGRWASLAAKRALDVIVAAAALVVLSPLLLVVALLVKATTPGPALFAQARWGKDNRVIRIWKFRSMYVDKQDVSGVRQTVACDPRVTPIGRFLRKSSIDELPQLWNVLIGDMSLVGPRPHAIGMKAAGIPYEVAAPGYFARHAMRPGLTGLAQVRGWRGEVADLDHARARLSADLEYIETYAFGRDLAILAATVPAVLTGRSAF